MKTLFNITVCGDDEILKQDFITALKEGYYIASNQHSNPFIVYDCSNKKDRRSLLSPFNKNHNIIVNNFDKLDIEDIEKQIKRKGFATIFTSKLSNVELCKLFAKSRHAELYMILVPYLIDVTDFDKTMKRFEMVTEHIFGTFEKCNRDT